MLTPGLIELLPITSVKSESVSMIKGLVTDRLGWKLQINGNICGIVIALILTQTCGL
jgi:hypothetical protein